MAVAKKWILIWCAITLILAGAGRVAGRSRPLVRIPVEISSNIVFVPVTINGRGPYPFVLDTGFQSCAIDHTLAKSLKLKVGPSEVVDAPGGKLVQATISDVSLRIGRMAIPNLSVSSLDVKQFEPFYGHPAVGILGYDLFQAFVVEISYQQKTLALFEPEGYSGSGTAIPIDTSPRQPYVTANVVSANGTRAEGRFELDTGSLDSVNLNLPFAKKHGIPEPSTPTRSVHGRSIGGETSGVLFRLGSVDIGDVRITSPHSAIVEDAVDRAGQICAEVLRRFTVTFDYFRRRVYLQKNVFFNVPFETDMAGWFIIASGPSLRGRKVFLVIADSPAAEAGVKEGDEIIQVDGKPISAFGLDRLRQLFKVQNATRRVRLARDGRQFEIVIKLRRLL